MRNSIFHILCLFVTAFIWGNGFVAQSVAMDDIGPWLFTFSRSLLAAFFIGILAIVQLKQSKQQLTAVQKENMIFGGVVTGTILAAGTMFQQFGVMQTSVAKAGFLTALYCVFVPFFGFFTRKKPSLRVAGSAILSCAGLYLLCMRGSFSLSEEDKDP